jgi:hypothetical protein
MIFCSSQIALPCGSIYANIMKKSSLQSQLSILLGDIKATYLDLVGGNKWEGITASPPAFSFIASPTNDDIDERDARALAAKANMPWDEWVRKFAECHYCGKKGHICPDCPDYLKKIESGKIKKPFRPHRNQPRPNFCRVPPPRRPQKSNTNPKMKAFLSAFNSLFDDNDETPMLDGSNEGSTTVDDIDDAEVDEDVYNFLAKVGCLKEYAVGWLEPTRAFSSPLSCWALVRLRSHMELRCD